MITIGSRVWGYYSGTADDGQAGEYRGIVKQVRKAEDHLEEYLVDYEDGVREWTPRVRARSE